METILADKEKILITKGVSNSVLPLLPLQNAFKEQNNK
jgi:hypothetical protein